MLLSRKLSLSALIDLCRALRHNLSVGITAFEVFQRQAKRGHTEIRPIAARVASEVRNGSSLTDAMRAESAFPPLFLALIAVGEETGHVAEIAGSLETYYILQQQLFRRFRSQVALPIIQFFLAVFIVAGVIWILGIIGSSTGTRPMAILGLAGTSGALIFLGLVFGTIGLIFATYRILSWQLRRKAVVDRILLRLPSIGSCLQAICLSRFTLALELTLDSGMNIMRALRYSLQATGNAAYESATEEVVDTLKSGDDLTTALEQTRLFPHDFIRILSVAEESGRVPEVMRQQCEYYQDEAARKLHMLAQMAGWSVWFIYAGFMIAMIFSLAQVYFSALGGF